jgi:hypothetical protein
MLVLSWVGGGCGRGGGRDGDRIYLRDVGSGGRRGGNAVGLQT